MCTWGGHCHLLYHHCFGLVSVSMGQHVHLRVHAQCVIGCPFPECQCFDLDVLTNGGCVERCSQPLAPTYHELVCYDRVLSVDSSMRVSLIISMMVRVSIVWSVFDRCGLIFVMSFTSMKK